jgi:glutathione peroxidase
MDFEILAFPSDDFGGQEPLEGAAIASFCESVGATNYPVFDKIRVRGPYAHPLYKFFADKKDNGSLKSIPRWNFHKFLIGRKFTIVTDHSALKTLTTAKVPKGRRARWMMELQQYNFEVKHRAGKSNTNADGLSRLL